MTRSKSMPGIPAHWLKYIKSHSNKYATGMFSREDAEQVAVMAFLTARAGFKPGKGVFERYAKASIRNALLNARRAEQKHWDQREASEVECKAPDTAPHWVGEEEVLEAVDQIALTRRVRKWADALSPKFASLWLGLYAQDMSQRELAADAGVSQACISQRNAQLLHIARKELAATNI